MPDLYNGGQVWRHAVLSLNTQKQEKGQVHPLKDSPFPVKVEKPVWTKINIGNMDINKKGGCVLTSTQRAVRP